MAKQHAQPLKPKQRSRKPRVAPSSHTDLAPRATVAGGDATPPLLTTTLSNLANMRHEMLKTVANNLRA